MCYTHTFFVCKSTEVGLLQCLMQNNYRAFLPAPPWGNAGLVVGLLRPLLPPSATLFGCLVCVICNSQSINSFIFKLGIKIVLTHIDDVHLFFIPRRSRRDIVLAASVRPSTLFVCPEPYLNTYLSDLIHSWYK